VTGSRTLLELVRGLLVRTYRIESGLAELAPFVIGDSGYRLLYAARPECRSVDTRSGGARTLVRETGDAVHARIYFPDSLIRRLEEHPPQRGLSDANVAEFATFVEEVDHLLLIAERARRDRPVSLFELELHANVSIELLLARFLAGGGGRIDPAGRAWLRLRLFGEEPGRAESPPLRARYRDAARYAVRLLDALPELPGARRLDVLRRFHAADCARKLEMIERGPA
jgi:hypothetical protein